MEISECPICLREIKNLSLMTINCKHQYCYKCMKKWLKNNPTCPMDRNQITDLHIYDGIKFEETISLSKILERFYEKITSKSNIILTDSIEASRIHTYLMECIQSDYDKNCYLFGKIKSHISTIKSHHKFTSKSSETYLKKVYQQIKISISQIIRNINKLILRIRKYKFHLKSIFITLSKCCEKLDLMKTKPTMLLSIQEEMEYHQENLFEILKIWGYFIDQLLGTTIYYQKLRSIVNNNSKINEKIIDFQSINI